MALKFAKPSPIGGFDKSAHEGCLLAFIECTSEADVKTAYGVDNAVRVKHVLCVTHLECYDDVLIFGKALVPRLLDVDGDVVVGRLEQGVAQPGRSAPWLLVDPQPEEIDDTERVFLSIAATLPSGATVIDAKALAGMRARRADEDDDPAKF